MGLRDCRLFENTGSEENREQEEAQKVTGKMRF